MNEFAGEIAGLKESVQFYVKGEDFANRSENNHARTAADAVETESG